MSASRLSLALQAGLFALPDGRVVVFGAGADTDLSALPKDRVLVVSTFRPDHDALAAAGWAVGTDAPETAELSVVVVPRAREAARALVSRAAAITRGPVVIDGRKTDGIESLLRDLRTRGEVSDALSKSHGKLAVLSAGADLADWADSGQRRIAAGFVTRPGVFSADAPDPGSVLLAEALPAKLGPRVADLGAGWGFLATRVLEREAVREIHLVEADLRALDCARLNVTDRRARFHWADATTFADPQGFDAIVLNPPFHRGRAGDPGLGQAFIDAAARLLRRAGQVWLVANRHLPYERALAARFAEVAETGGDRSYKLFRASRPRRTG